MATLHLNLPDDVRTLAEARAAEAGHTSLDAYVAALVRADAEQDASEELQQALLEGLNSGPAIDVTPAFWAALKARRPQPRA